MATPKPDVIVSMPSSQDRPAKFPSLNGLLFVVTGGVIPLLITFGLGKMNEMMMIAIVIAVIAVCLMLAQPFAGLILFTVLLYTRPEESIPALAGMHFPLLVAIITLVGMLLQMMLNRVPLVSNPLIGFMTGFTAFAIVSGIVGGTFSAAVMDFARLLVLVVLILNLIRTPQRYKTFLVVQIICTCYLSLYSIYLYSTGVVTVDNGIVDGLARSKGTGIFSDPNDLAATIIAGVALALSQIVQGQKITRPIYLVALGTMMWAILLTNSRGGLLALIAVIGGFCLAFSRRKGLAIVVAAALIGLALVAAPGRMKNFDSNESSANSRFQFWQVGLEELQGHPFTGAGYTKFPDVNNGFVAHNTFVNCFAELGFFAYFCWMGCIYMAFRQRTPNARSGDIGPGDPQGLIGARLALLGYLVAVFSITRTYSPILYIAICMPIVQQTANGGQHNLPFYTKEEKGSVLRRTLALSCLMVIVIRIMVQGK